MSLWGNKDSVYSDGTIAISGTTVTGTATTFNTAGLINEGDIIRVNTDTGEYVERVNQLNSQIIYIKKNIPNRGEVDL